MAPPATLAEWLSGCSSHSGRLAGWLSYHTLPLPLPLPYIPIQYNTLHYITYIHYTHTHAHTHMYIYIYRIFIYVFFLSTYSFIYIYISSPSLITTSINPTKRIGTLSAPRKVRSPVAYTMQVADPFRIKVPENAKQRAWCAEFGNKFAKSRPSKIEQ